MYDFMESGQANYFCSSLNSLHLGLHHYDLIEIHKGIYVAWLNNTHRTGWQSVAAIEEEEHIRDWLPKFATDKWPFYDAF